MARGLTMKDMKGDEGGGNIIIYLLAAKCYKMWFYTVSAIGPFLHFV